MKNVSKNAMMQEMSVEEMVNVNGGGLIEGLGILVAYGCWAIDFCYNMGKD